MSEDELARIAALANAATPPPWTAQRDQLGHWRIVWPHSQNSSVMRKGKIYSDEDVAFIAGARSDVPRLVEEVRRLREALAALRDEAGEDLDRPLDAHYLARTIAEILTPPAGNPPPVCG